jgi:mannitol-1-/sugar-/sorbitol-6-/2-deoxyglucose-6-phosphatase
VRTNADPIRSVIFDMDGLLVDTVPIWRRVGDETFAALGADISEVSASGVALAMRVGDAMDLFCSYAGVSAAERAELEQRIVDGVVDAISQHAELMPGARFALDFCKRLGLTVAMATGSTPPIIDAVLARFGLADRFAAVCSASEEPFGKPHPSVFLTAAAKLGERPPACLVLEDAVDGCIAAKAASMRVIAVPDASVEGDPRYVIADLVLPSLEHLADDASLAVMGLDAVRVD